MIKLESGIRASRNHAEVPQKANQLALHEIIAVCSRCLSMKYEQCVKLLTVPSMLTKTDPFMLIGIDPWDAQLVVR